MSFLSMIGGVKGIAVIALLIVLGGWAFVQKRNVAKAQEELAQVTIQRDMAAGERDKAIAAARENAVTIGRLEQERDLANQALNQIQISRDSNRETRITREIIIQNGASVPANQTVGAPVLGEVISSIQSDRARRRPGATQSIQPVQNTQTKELRR